MDRGLDHTDRRGQLSYDTDGYATLDMHDLQAWLNIKCYLRDGVAGRT